MKDPPKTLLIRLMQGKSELADDLSLRETIRIIENDDPEISVQPGMEEGKIDGLPNMTLLESIGSFSGHVWKAEVLREGNKDKEGENVRLDWYFGTPVKRGSEFMNSNEEVIDVSCVGTVCAFMLRSHLSPSEVRLAFVDEQMKVVN